MKRLCIDELFTGCAFLVSFEILLRGYRYERCSIAINEVGGWKEN